MQLALPTIILSAVTLLCPALVPTSFGQATIDETQASHVIYLNADAPVASDDSQGTDPAKPMKTFAGAWSRAREVLSRGTGVKIQVAAGVYRESQTLRIGELNKAAQDAVLVIEGQAPGKVIFSGSRTAGFESSTWQVVNAATGLYKHAWDRNWGPQVKGYYKPTDAAAHRQEMLFVDGRRMAQVALEQYQWTDGGGRVFDEVGMVVGNNAGKSKGYIYQGCQSPDILKPGEFAVAELGPQDTEAKLLTPDGQKTFAELFQAHPHSFPDTLFLRLPEGVKSLDGLTIEVADLQQTTAITDKNNLVLRNLIFEHAAQRCNASSNASIFINAENQPTFRQAQNRLIENCEFRANNGRGLDVSNARHVTIRRVRVCDNGGMGMNLQALQDAVVEDVVATGNGWRNAMSEGYSDHATAGIDFSGKDCVFRRIDGSDNFTGRGFRADEQSYNVTLEDSRFNRNTKGRSGGVFYEVIEGPNVIRRVEMVGNDNEGLMLLNVHNMTVEDCRMSDNVRSQVTLLAENRPRDTVAAWGSEERTLIAGVKNLSLSKCLLSTTQSDVPLVLVPPHASVKASIDLVNKQFQGNGNRYFAPDAATAFQFFGPDGKRVIAGLKQWQAVAQDTGSNWLKAPPPSTPAVSK